MVHRRPGSGDSAKGDGRRDRPAGKPGPAKMLSSRAMNRHTSRPVVLCLSGHDPSGGAGLQADIEALIAQGCHAAPTVTALTVQDTVDVADFRVLDRAWVMAQANAVIADLPIAAVKLGMLGSVEMVDTVLELMQKLPGVPLVCDPVLRAGGGGSLGPDDVGYAIRERLFPVAAIATPNLPEARILAELPEGTPDQCAEKLLPHVRHLLITGGHGDETEVINRLYSRDGQVWTSSCARLPDRKSTRLNSSHVRISYAVFCLKKKKKKKKNTP